MQVAQAVAEGSADVGLGIETAALAYGIGFIPLTVERYDFIVPQEAWPLPAIQALARWLTTEPARVLIGDLGGYDTSVSGEVIWVSE
jgi:putative molybdopterin biosynthesis protein